MVLKPVGTQNTPKKQYNMDTRIAKNPSEIPQSHNDFGEWECYNLNKKRPKDVEKSTFLGFSVFCVTIE